MLSKIYRPLICVTTLTIKMSEKNIFDAPLELCSDAPKTGYLRDGYCRPSAGDSGKHLVCSEVSREFLDFTASRGNNLSTLSPGDRWCLCAHRWKEAYDHGISARVIPAATSKLALQYVPSEALLSASVSDDGLYAAHRAGHSMHKPG